MDNRRQFFILLIVCMMISLLRADDHSSGAVRKQASLLNSETSQHAVEQLQTYLETARAERNPLDEQLFATVPLTKDDAEKAQELLWDDHVAFIKQTRIDEMRSRQLTEGDLTMPFYYTVNGDKPEGGRSLFISLHGGGGAPKQVNDSQWNNQKRLYQIPEGVYLVPRAPTNTWDLWHQGHIDGMFDRLIEDFIVFGDVNPNRVYLLGYSAGGDGVYRLAPRMADRWAAASMMAGHPGDVSPTNLYNLPFTIHVGGKDAAYNRNQVARQWGEKLDQLQQKEPDGYVHWTKIYEDKGHWVDKGGAEALPWMMQYTRQPLPRRIIWQQWRHPRFYWLATEEVTNNAVVDATLSGQQIDLKSEQLEKLSVRVNDRMLDMDTEIVVTSNGCELFRGQVERTIGVMARTLAERGDPESVFSGEIPVVFKSDLARN